MENKRTFIELFAGCGGLSLGLEASGFKLYFANEISPMAGETYAYNLLNENLRENPNPKKTLWISSKFPKGDIKRLSENPNNLSKIDRGDLTKEINLKGKLIIGDILKFNKFLKKTSPLISEIQKKKIDLVSGGPPCQSFSSAGRRQRDNKRNSLPWAFIDLVELTKPKIVLLENVSGILRAFNTGGSKYYAWFEVAKAFCQINYIPICMHINAKYFGLPQNRPRFVLMAIRKKELKHIEHDSVLEKAIAFYKDVKKSNGMIKRHESAYNFYELDSFKDLEDFNNSPFLPKPIATDEAEFKSVSYAIDIFKDLDGDVNFNQLMDDNYYNLLKSYFPEKGNYTVKNHKYRKHSKKIKRRFIFLKVIEQFENGDKARIIKALRAGSHNELGQRLVDSVNDKLSEIDFGFTLEQFLINHQSKKHSQRALNESKPAPATLSIPDDVCHYAEGIDRTLSVREMARIQSFPDWFEFRAKDTTGGLNRRYEVPNYTQVGNAVPPLLAKELGNWIESLLKLMDK